jgi:hypothetical protein
MKPNLVVIKNDPIPAPEPDPVDPKAVATLTSALNNAFQIRAGRELVYVLGSGQEESNIEALETWVRTSLERYGIAPTRHGLNILVAELEKQLTLWELDQSL